MTLEGGWTARVAAETGVPLTWVEDHIYRVADAKITELWPAGGPEPG